MQILVSVASKHGATAEIGEIIATGLRDAGLEVITLPPDRVESVEPYDAVILGSAVYAGKWMESARAFADRHASALEARPVWLFSSGPLGDPPMPSGDVPEMLNIAERLGARGHRTFAGRIDRDQLGIVERAITAVVHAPDGDFRDVADIRGWADEVIEALAPHQAVAS
jgi:menaquinone-dependent protoporphyrinogen oxidase